MTTYRPPADNDVPPLRERVGTVVIGAVAGLAAVAFHAVMNLAESVRTELAVFATAHGIAAQFSDTDMWDSGSNSSLSCSPFCRPVREHWCTVAWGRRGTLGGAR